jgi:STAS domain
LSGVTFMGSTGVAMLVGIRKAATTAGMELRLDGIPARISQLLQITGLADHFGVTAGPPVSQAGRRSLAIAVPTAARLDWSTAAPSIAASLHLSW